MDDIETDINGTWWRFSNYEIWEPERPRTVPDGLRDHFRYIRSGPGATLETYQQPISGGFGSQPSDLRSALLEIDLANEAQILEFCTHFGFLGILTETLWSVSLAPRWEHLTNDPRDPLLFPSQTRYTRTRLGWSSLPLRRMKGENDKLIQLDDVDHDEDWLHTLVDPADTSFPSASASFTRLFSEDMEDQSLARALGQYFPAVDAAELETYEYPMPMSVKFWGEYAEPLERFRAAIRGFRDMLENLAQIGPTDELPIEAIRSVGRGRTQLHAILSVSPALGVTDDGTFEPRWAFSSLLAIAAFEVWQRLIGGQSVKHCKRTRCRRLFIPSNNAREYCSTRCSQAEEKARQRAEQAKLRSG